MAFRTTIYRRNSTQNRSIFRVSRILTFGMLVAILAACFLKVDIVSRAPGMVVPQKATRPVAATIDGIVGKFHVQDGQAVDAGELLVSLEEPSIQIQRNLASEKIKDLKLERVVTLALLSDSSKEKTAASIERLSPSTATAEKWRTFFAGKQAVKRAAIAEFDALLLEAKTQLEAYEGRIADAAALVDLMRMKDQRVQEMVRRGVQNEFVGLDSLIEFRELEQHLNNFKSLKLEKSREIETIKVRKERFIQSSNEALLTKRVELDKSISQITSDIRTLEDQLEKLEIRAPIQGVIQEVNTSALSLRAGTKTLLNLVPVENGLEVIARIKNQDISDIQPGQTVTLLFDAFPVAVYGTSSAIVETISEDVAGISESIPIPTEVVDQRVLLTEAEKAQPFLSYITTLSLIEDESSPIEVRPGLSVLANIKTGEQRIIVFFLNPLFRAWHSTLKEL